LNLDGAPYWDNPSFDGAQQSIGYVLTGQNPSPLGDAPGSIPFWGESFNPLTDAGGGWDTDFFFNRTTPTTSATFKLEVSARTGINEFGWYDVTNTSVLHPIFTGADSAGDQELIALSTQYGFYVKTAGNAVFRTQSWLNPAGEQTHQHFALFRENAAPMAEVYWLAIEDLTLGELGSGEGGVGDYNDMVIKLVSVPEPSAGVLLGAGLALLLAGFWARRR
jgi:hypothetical protein